MTHLARLPVGPNDLVNPVDSVSHILSIFAENERTLSIIIPLPPLLKKRPGIHPGGQPAPFRLDFGNSGPEEVFSL